MEEKLSSFEEELEKNGHISFTNIGRSMEPLIKQGRDVVIVGKKQPGRLKKYDVVLYRRKGRCILHRIHKVTENGYVIAGDHNFVREYDVTDDMIIGVLTGLIKNGEKYDLNSPSYLRYERFVCGFFYPRAVFLYAKTVPGRIMNLLRSVKRYLSISF